MHRAEARKCLILISLASNAEPSPISSARLCPGYVRRFGIRNALSPLCQRRIRRWHAEEIAEYASVLRSGVCEGLSDNTDGFCHGYSPFTYRINQVERQKQFCLSAFSLYYYVVSAAVIDAPPTRPDRNQYRPLYRQLCCRWDLVER